MPHTISPYYRTATLNGINPVYASLDGLGWVYQNCIGGSSFSFLLSIKYTYHVSPKVRGATIWIACFPYVCCLLDRGAETDGTVPRKRAARHRGRVKAFPKVCRVLFGRVVLETVYGQEEENGTGRRRWVKLGSSEDGWKAKETCTRTSLTNRMTPRSPSTSPPVWVTRPV